jgi:sulfur transfer protein SufE
LVVANNAASTVSLLLGNGDGTFQGHVDTATAKGLAAVVTGDFNGDGKLDVAAATKTSNTVSVLLQQ